MASEPTVTREMAEAAWRHLWAQKRWAIEDVQEAIRAALAVQARTHVVVCSHSPYLGRCAHCDVPFKNGQPMLAASTENSNDAG